MPEIIGEYLDRLVTVEMRRLEEPLRGITRPIYDAILDKQGKPATTLAAQALLDTAGDGDYVFFTTGAGTEPWMPKGEVDGPPGIASIARALHLGRGVFPVCVVAENHRDIVEATLTGMGLNVLSQEMATTRYWPSAIVETIPYRTEEQGDWAKDLFDHYRPKAVVASEKLGPNKLGVTNSATAVPRPAEWDIDAARLFDEAKARDLPRISIGDVGNEMGYGIVYDEVCEILKPIELETIVSVVECDVLIHAANADWGAYALAAALAFLLRDSSLLVPPDLHRRALEACVAAGAVGQFGHQAHVGGTDLDTQLAFVRLMRELIDRGNERKVRRPF